MGDVSVHEEDGHPAREENGTTIPGSSPRGANSRPPSHTRAPSRTAPRSSITVITGPAAPTRTAWRSEPFRTRARLERPLPISSTT